MKYEDYERQIHRLQSENDVLRKSEEGWWTTTYYLNEVIAEMKLEIIQLQEVVRELQKEVPSHGRAHGDIIDVRRYK